MSGMTQVSRNNGQSPSVPREDFENAGAAAKLVHPGMRKVRGSPGKTSAKRMLRYLEDSLRVGVTELQEHLGISEEAGVSIRKIAQQAMNENGQIFLKV